jgi:hypothetical protein
VPLNDLNYTDLIELVAGHDIRPERPVDHDAPHLSDAIWDLAEQCWVKDASSRPNANDVCDIVSRLYESGAPNHLQSK